LTSMLLERTAELAALRQRLAAAAAGHGQTVVISGEAGIGKSALTRAFLADPGMAARSLRGACENLKIAEPLAPLHDLARQAGWSLPPSISDPGGRLAVFSEALNVLEAPDRPTVLVIEDLHWADDATIDFLRFIGRRIETLRILLIVTSRDDDNFARGHIRRVTTAIPPDGQTRLRLEPLSLTAVASLSQDTGLDAAEVLRLTAGNAFFVSEILRSGTSGQLASVQDFVLERASALPASARQVLEMVSVVPGQAEIDLVTGLGAELAGIDSCIDSGLLESDGKNLFFRH
jgi:predicted ATPase